MYAQPNPNTKIETIVVKVLSSGRKIGGGFIANFEFMSKVIRETEKAFLVEINDNGFTAQRCVSRKFIVAGNLAQTELVCEIPFQFSDSFLTGKF